MENTKLEVHLFQLYINMHDEKHRLLKRVKQIDLGISEIIQILLESQYIKGNTFTNSLNTDNEKITFKRVEDYNSIDVQNLLNKYNENDDDDDDNSSNLESETDTNSDTYDKKILSHTIKGLKKL